MPYRDFTKEKDGKTLYCMTSQDTGKTYCFKSEAAREKGKKMHEAFKHGWKPTRIGKDTYKKANK